ncbi:MAG: DUF126 domain-containing protein [Crenarchaeota archaeon]|nr:DUF126 domain-containing protein [Thermoproteota archaeon]
MCRVVYCEKDRICGRVVKTDYISLLGDVDPDRGALRDGREVKDKILVYVQATGSTVGSYILYALSKRNRKPLAILCVEIDNLTLVGCVLGEIPLVKISREEYELIRDGEEICVEFDNVNREECRIVKDERELHT